jgi:hypothetical protein
MGRKARREAPKLGDDRWREREPMPTDMHREIRGQKSDEIRVRQISAAIRIGEKMAEVIGNASSASRRSGMFLVPDAASLAAVSEPFSRHQF